MGIESADDAVLEACRKGYATEAIRGAFARTRKHGIRTVGTFVVGLPEETEGSLERSLELALELDLDFMSLNVAVPRFGTAFRADALASGLINPTDLVMDQSGATVALNTRTLTRQDVDRLKRRMIRRFYLRPSWLWKRLRDVSGPRELFAQAREGVALLSRNT
jgi:radical SAM superfamily enzyme YgiQ (UPF0313 family)